MAKKKEGQRLSIYLTSEALEIYDSWPRHERSKMVSEAIIEKHTKEEEIFTPEQKEIIDMQNMVIEVLEKEIDKLRERIEKLEKEVMEK